MVNLRTTHLVVLVDFRPFLNKEDILFYIIVAFLAHLWTKSEPSLNKRVAVMVPKLQRK